MTDKRNNEDYIQISQHHFLKKDKFDYFTEKDLIERMSKKYGASYQEVEDLYLRAMEHIRSKLEKPDNNYETGFYIPYFGYFRKKTIKAEDLLSDRDTITFKRAKILLDRYCAKNTSIIGIK